MRFRDIAALLVILLASLGIATAQETTGSIQGRVVDSQALAVPGALATPGPGTNQRSAVVPVPEDEPHTGGVAPLGACTDRPATMGAEAEMVTE